MRRLTISSMLPGIIAAFAFIVSLFASASCKFISFPSDDGSGNSSSTLYFGIWYYQGWSVVQTPAQGTVVLDTCFNYPDGTILDSKWRSAKAFSAMALIFGGVVTFWALLAACTYPSRRAYKAGGGIYVLCCLFQGLTLLFLDSNACRNNVLITDLQAQVSDADLSFPSFCSMADGAKYAIAGTVLWFVAAIAAIKAEPPQRSPITVETQDVTYTKTTGKDGTVVVSETVVKGKPVAVGGPEKAEQPV